MASKKTKPSKTYSTIFVVEGSGDFPVDMLRYDSAFPLFERDSYIAMHEAAKTRRVVLMSRRVNDNPPTAERWRSFCWNVVGVFHNANEAELCRDEKAPPRGEVGP
jgi:hypothetical protein